MRIKINDKIYRLKEIESGVDSLMELVEEPQYKDGDFVVNEAGCILIFKEKFGDFIYDHAYLSRILMLFTNSAPTSCYGIKRYATEAEKQKLLDALAKEGKRWNAEKLCVEDIPVRKFNVGDKVVLKSGYKKLYGLKYLTDFDHFIGKPLTIKGYAYIGSVYFSDCPYIFDEDWLEPYEELKEGDLAIFWDSNKEEAFIGVYKQFLMGVIFQHKDHRGNLWKNAIKFESREQYEKLLKGEI